MKNTFENGQGCKSFDFNKCSFDKSSKDYPQLFEFQNDEIVYVIYSATTSFN